MKWLRLWHDARTDRKLESLTDAQYRVWANLLIFASEQTERGVIEGKTDALLAVEVARGNVDLLRETIDQLRALEIVSDRGEAICFVHWDKRQRVGDDSAYRQRDSRKTRQEVSEPSRDTDGVSRDGHVTVPECAVPETEQEVDTEKEYVGTHVPTAQAPRRVDLLRAVFGVLARRLGQPATTSERGRYNRATKELVDAGVDAVETERLIDAAESRWGAVAITPTAISSNVALLRRPPRNGKAIPLDTSAANLLAVNHRLNGRTG